MQTIKHISTHPGIRAELARREPVSAYLRRPLRAYEEALRDYQKQREQIKGEVA